MKTIVSTSEVRVAEEEENAMETNKEAINVLIYSPTNDEQKQELANAIFYAQELLIKTNFISKTVSSKISNRSMLVGKKIFKRFMQMFGEMKYTDEKVLDLEANTSIPPQKENMKERENVRLKNDAKDNESVAVRSPLQNKIMNERESSPENYEEQREANNVVPFTKKLKAVRLAELHPKWSIATICKRSTMLLTRKEQLARWKVHIKQGGTLFDKYEIINSNVYDRFLKAKENETVAVTTRMLQQWAIEAATQFIGPCFNFIAFNQWANNFKRKYGISLRRVTESACNENKE